MICVSITAAQDQKIGYVNTDQILAQMSEYQGIQEQLSTLSSEWNKQLDKIEQEIEQLKEDFKAKEILYTEELKKQKQQEIQNKVQQRQQYLDEKFGAEGEYFQKQKELLEPIQRKVFEAINKVANDQNFDFVFDRAQNSNMLYSEQEWNLNDEVLQALGISLNGGGN
ncbi:OmpH family outer membrane protein [Fodinibius sp.]|uniref:OmpH family outer membrane protein n=1 Tax=Fodinibius sp. TaxID=1872440 RepID=UPI002ACDE25A|nr:OmpH family outer membrane protein [Fodinibius sp.]MDZ7658435.1 OmpH family outer membrane protein [Fodinibius sp.]